MPGLFQSNNVNTPNDVAWWEMQLHLLHLIDLIANIVRSGFNKRNFWNIFKFIVNYFTFLIYSRSQRFHHLNHEIGIIRISPFKVAVWILKVLRNGKEFSICNNKVFEQKIHENLSLLLLVELVIIPLISFSFHRSKFIVGPLIPKMLFNLLLKLRLNSTLIILLQQTQELGKSFRILVFSLNLLVRIDRC